MKKLIVLLVSSLMFFTACGKKKDNNTQKPANKKEIVEKKKAKPQKEEKKKQVTKTEDKEIKLPKSTVTQEQIDKLSEVFAYGDKLIEERKKLQKEISDLSKNFKDISAPLQLKKDAKYKYVSVTHFSNAVWTYIYKNDKKKSTERLFWITVTYRYDLKDNKRYNEKFAGYDAIVFKNSGVWVLLKDSIEIRISANDESVKNEKAMEEVLKSFDLKSMESIFDKKTKFPKLKEYFLKIKELNLKIQEVNKKFKEKENDMIEAIKPFIRENEGILKGLDLSKKEYTTSNNVKITAKKDNKNLFFVYIGRHEGFFGVISLFKGKNAKFKKVGSYKALLIDDKASMIKLPTLVLKSATFYDNEYKNPQKLSEILANFDIDGLAKVK